MIQSLKHRLINWLGVATKDEVQLAHDHAIHFTVSQVAKLVKKELDKDERTMVVNVTVSAPVQLDADAIKVAFAKAIAKL